MKLYLAGPMTGYKDLNFPLFHAETARLRALGYEVVNPAEINGDSGARWEDCMRQDIAQLVTCDGVACLPMWTTSRGARLEVHIGTTLAMSVRMASELVEGPAPRVLRCLDADACKAGQVPCPHLHLCCARAAL